MAFEQDKRIPELPELIIVDGELYIPIYSPATDITHKIKASLLFPEVNVTSYAWNPATDYNVDEIVVQDNQIWISQQTPNLNKMPGTNPLYWVASTKSIGSGIRFWQAGVYTEADVYVASRDAQNRLLLYRLVPATRPFNSTNFATEVAAGTWEAFGKAYTDDIVNGMPWKFWAQAATTGNIVLSGTQTIDTRALVVGNICLVKAQTDPKENGWYFVAAGAWVRCSFADGSSELTGAIGYVTGGSVNAKKIFRQITDLPTVGVSNIVFEEVSPDRFKGYYTSEANLIAAHPTGSAGDYADVDTGVGDDVIRYLWDVNDAAWVPGGSGGLIAFASETVAGTVEEATQVQTDAGTDVGETGAKLFVPPSKLAAWWTGLKALAHTWALKQTFTVAPRFSSTTASQALEVDASKDLISVAKGTAYNKNFASDAETITGTETLKPIPPSALTAWWTNIKTLAQTISVNKWTFSAGIILSAQIESGKKVLSYLDTTGEIIKLAWAEINTAVRTITFTGSDTSMTTVLMEWKNSGSASIMKVANGLRVIIGELETNSIIEIGDSVTSDNAVVRFNDNQAKAWKITNKNGDEFLFYRSTTGALGVVHRQQQEFDFGKGFKKVHIQAEFTTDTTAAAFTNLLSIALAADQSVTVNVNHLHAYDTARNVRFASGTMQGYARRDNASVVSGTNPAYTLSGDDAGAGTSWRIIANNTAKTLDIDFQNNSTTGKTWKVSLDATYIISAKP